MDTHLSHGLRCVIGQMRTSSHQLEIETGRFRGILAKDGIRQLCHREPETELHFICHCPVYYEIRGRYHCLFRDGFGPLSKVMSFQDQRCLGLYLLEIHKYRESMLKNSKDAQQPQRQITQFFRPTMTRPETQSSPQNMTLQRSKGILIDQALKLGRLKRPRMQGKSHYRKQLQQKIRTILLRNGVQISHAPQNPLPNQR